jgi:hypothetical protein
MMRPHDGTGQTTVRIYPVRSGGTNMETLRAVKFLFLAPVILAFLVVVNLMTWSGEWWVQWAALGLGIAWVVSLVKVIRGVILAGGLAALGALLMSRRR